VILKPSNGSSARHNEVHKSHSAVDGGRRSWEELHHCSSTYHLQISSYNKILTFSQYCYGLFPYFYDPGWDRDSKEVTIDGETHKIELEDFSTFVTPDQPFDLRDRVIQSADGFLLVYDITSKASFDSIKSIHAEVRRKGRPAKPVVIMGNKCDDNDERVIFEETGRRLAKELRCRFAEVSARNGNGLDEVFLELATHINNGKKREEKLTTNANCQKLGRSLIECLVKVSACLERLHVKILYWMYGPDRPLRNPPGPRYVEVRQVRHSRVASASSISHPQPLGSPRPHSSASRPGHTRHGSKSTIKREPEMAITTSRDSPLSAGHVRHGSRNTIRRDTEMNIEESREPSLQVSTP
jgi:GTPase SAR1 family protein